MSPRPVPFVLFALASCLGARAVYAQAVLREDAPDVVMRQFLANLSNRRWAEAATALDLTALGAYRDSLLAWRRNFAPARDPTIDDILRAQPGLPRAVAEYQLSEARRFLVEQPQPAVPEFPGVPSYDSLRTLPQLALGVSWLQGKDYREAMRRDLRRLSCPPSADSLVQQLPLAVEVLGAVGNSDSLAYVVFADPQFARARTDFFSLGPLVAQLRHTEGGWRVIPTTSFFTHANTYSQLAACPGRRGPS
jgi:hypothetical protein